jgi:uncharacterized protein (DUF2235 family)
MKRLAIFCDGTWNSADQAANGVPSPTNVVKLALRVAKRDRDMAQVVYYDQGVGTGNSLDKLTGGAFGKGLNDNLHGAYRFLMLNYEMGDQIYLFGFSRGAYTVRSLAGMVRKCGILHRRASDRYHDAIAIYSDLHHPDADIPRNFRRAHSIAGDGGIPIRMIGVWDTVGALGIPVRGLRWLTADTYRFHDVELSGSVERAYQALAIDERRAPFEAARWTYKPKNGQVVEQVWFCGVHSDIGGGYPRERQHGLLSDFTLTWMRDKAIAGGLAIDPEADAAFPPQADHRGTLHNSKTGLYRLTPGIDRVIGLAAEEKAQPDEKSTLADPSQHLHESVYKRWDDDPEYRPKNLRAYFARVSDPRAAQP